jgi:hypothetical protein
MFYQCTCDACKKIINCNTKKSNMSRLDNRDYCEKCWNEEKDPKLKKSIKRLYKQGILGRLRYVPNAKKR